MNLLSQFQELSPGLQALLATLFTWGMTTLGAATVFLVKAVKRKVLDGMLGFAAMMALDVAFS